MKIQVHCTNPSCGAILSADDSKVGKRVKCPECGHAITIGAGDRSETPVPLETRPIKARAPGKEQAAPLPKQIGRFEIRKRLGSGGFGTVYLAHDPVLDRDVALKVPQSSVLENPGAKERFLREPKAAAQLQHPNIVPIFDTGTDGEHHYIASAFIEGKTLQETIALDRLDFRHSAELVRKLAGALDYAHSKGVVHRDVKPANVMVDNSGQPMLMDFGLAHLQESEDQLTRDGAVMGTPAYMAPEQADRGRGEVGPASDQYALGVVLYHLLCGEPPFSGPPSVVLFNVLNQEPKGPRVHNSAIPKDLETVCLKAMAKEPEARYRDCAALADDLHLWLNDEPIRARRMGPAVRFGRWCRKNPALASSTLLAFAFLAASTVLFAFYSRTAEARAVAEQKRYEIELRQCNVQAELALRQADYVAAIKRLSTAKTVLEREQAKSLAEETLQRDHASKAILLQEELALAEQRGAKLSARLAAIKKELEADWYQEPTIPGRATANMRHRVGVGERLNNYAIVRRPSPIPGVRSWTIEMTPSRGAITSCEFSPNQQYMAVGSRDGVMRIWQVSPLQLRYVIAPLTSEFASLEHPPVWSPCGNYLAFLLGHQIHVWDVHECREILTARAQSSAGFLSWSSCGRWIADGSALYDVKTQEWSPSLDGERALHAFSPDGSRLATSVPDSGVIKIWDIRKREVIREIRFGSAFGGGQISWSPDGSYLAQSHRASNSTGIYNVADGSLVTMLKICHPYWDSSMSWARNPQRLAVFPGGQAISWSPSEGQQPIPEMSGFGSISPDGRLVAKFSFSSILLVDAASGKQISLNGGPESVGEGPPPAKYTHCMAIDPTGQMLSRVLYYGQSDDYLRIVELDGLKEFHADPFHKLSGGVAWVGNNGTLLRTDSWDNQTQVGIANMATGAVRFWDAGIVDQFNYIASSPNGQLTLIGDGRSTVLVQLDSPETLKQIAASGPVAWSQSGKLFAVGIEVFDTKTLNTLAAISLDTESFTLKRVMFSPDDRIVAIQGYQSQSYTDVLWLFESRSGRLLDRWVVPASAGCQWQGLDRIVVADRQGGITHINLATRTMRTVCENDQLWTVEFDPKGRFAAAATGRSTVKFVNLQTAQTIATWLYTNDGQNMVISPEGHWRGDPGVEKKIVYVVDTVDGQETLTPDHMRDKYGWVNDPSKVVVKWPEPMTEAMADATTQSKETSLVPGTEGNATE